MATPPRPSPLDAIQEYCLPALLLLDRVYRQFVFLGVRTAPYPSDRWYALIMELSIPQYSEIDDPVARALQKWVSRQQDLKREILLSMSTCGLGDDQAAQRVMRWVRKQPPIVTKIVASRKQNRLEVVLSTEKGNLTRFVFPAGSVVKTDFRTRRFATASWLLLEAEELEANAGLLGNNLDLIDELTTAVSTARQTAMTLAGPQEALDSAPPGATGDPHLSPMDDKYLADSKALAVTASPAVSEAWSLLTLPERSLMIRVLSDVPDREIAEELGLAITSVRAIKAHCLQALRDNFVAAETRHDQSEWP